MYVHQKNVTQVHEKSQSISDQGYTQTKDTPQKKPFCVHSVYHFTGVPSEVYIPQDRIQFKM